MYVHHKPVCSLPPIQLTGYLIALLSVPDSVLHRMFLTPRFNFICIKITLEIKYVSSPGQKVEANMIIGARVSVRQQTIIHFRM